MRSLLIASALALALCLTFAIAGCADTLMVQAHHVDTTTITWVDSHNIAAACGPAPGPGVLSGCAWVADDYSRCIVTLPKTSPDWLVAHEMRHCFGYRH